MINLFHSVQKCLQNLKIFFCIAFNLKKMSLFFFSLSKSFTTIIKFGKKLWSSENKCWNWFYFVFYIFFDTVSFLYFVIKRTLYDKVRGKLSLYAFYVIDLIKESYLWIQFRVHICPLLVSRRKKTPPKKKHLEKTPWILLNSKD